MLRASAKGLLGVLILLAVWQAIAMAWGSPLLFPSPLDVWSALQQMVFTGELFEHLGASLQRVLVGLIVGAPIGVVLGCAMGISPGVNSWFDPYLRLANSVPAIALIPFCLLWFGISEFGRYVLMIYIVIVTMTFNARQGVLSVPSIRMKASQTLGVTGVRAFLRVTIPSVFPSILAGFRTSIGLGVMVVVAAEMFGANSGFGSLIMAGRANYTPNLMFIGILGLGVLSLALDRAFMFSIEYLMPRWSSKRRVR
jgi:ABC-type nitrate/sulfonate/bicarbonate transport system permease component